VVPFCRTGSEARNLDRGPACHVSGTGQWVKDVSQFGGSRSAW
jgi:hypothetical protein